MVQENYTPLIEKIYNIFTRDGNQGMREVFELILNEIAKIERAQYLGVEPYERSESRVTHANGFKDKALKTRVGELNLKIPQTRDCKFYPTSIEKGLRSERALGLAIAEMYMQGVSTRKIAAIAEKLCGVQVTSDEVSRLNKQLDEILDKWRNRQLGSCQYLYLDARYEKVRNGGVIVDCAVLIAVGVNADGHRDVIGVSVAISEAEVHWRKFLQTLQERGLHGVKLIINDDHAGLKAARRAVFPSIPWQRCQFHLQQNAQSYITKVEYKKIVANDIRGIFNSPTEIEAELFKKKIVAKYSKTMPGLSDWMENNIHEGLTVFKFPVSHRKKIRTSNVLERLNREIKRRTSVAVMFPNEASCLRLVSAILMEISEDWLFESRYLNINDKEVE